MRKITCLLLLIQSGFMMAQTKTVVTPNGEKVTIRPSAPGTADNGLTITDYNVQLGGALVQPSVLTTTATNTLAVQGLQTGLATDEFVTTDSNGILHKVPNNSWNLNGNAGTVPGTNFIGTSDDVDLVFKINGIQSGRINKYNTSFGYESLPESSTGKDNIALGSRSLMVNTTGNNNIAIGTDAMNTNTTGTNNLAIGNYNLNYNTTGSNNISLGNGAMNSNDTGNNNLAIGTTTLRAITNGSSNTALGTMALANIENSYSNTAVGNGSFSSLTSGTDNIALGVYSGSAYGVPLGEDISRPELTKINKSVMIGNGSAPLNNNDTNEVVIGYEATGRGSNTVQIGNRDMTSIGGAVNWSIDSDLRLKKDIVTSTYGLNFISKLRPVTYKMKTGPTGLQSGFIAQEVEAAANGIGYEFNGIVKPQNESDFYSLRYSEFVVPLVKAVQEQQSQIESLQKQLENKDAKILEFEKRLLLLEQKIK